MIETGKPERTPVNNGGTELGSDAPVTQPGSMNVLRADLLAMSRRHGADTPIGHHCENLRQMFDFYARLSDEKHRAQIEKNIRRQWADLIGLTGGMQ